MAGENHHAQDWDRARDHAWRYFELHAGQRMTMFNFFVALSGLVTAGLGTIIQGPPRLGIVGILLGLLLVLLSFVFWKLDQRSSFLIKHAEVACVEIERQLLPSAGRLFMSEPERFAAASARGGFSSVWTFGHSLRIAFVGMAVVGAAATGICAMRVGGVLTWDAPKAPEGTKHAPDPNPPSATRAAPTGAVPVKATAS